MPAEGSGPAKPHGLGGGSPRKVTRHRGCGSWPAQRPGACNTNQPTNQPPNPRKSSTSEDRESRWESGHCSVCTALPAGYIADFCLARMFLKNECLRWHSRGCRLRRQLACTEPIKVCLWGNSGEAGKETGGVEGEGGLASPSPRGPGRASQRVLRGAGLTRLF